MIQGLHKAIQKFILQEYPWIKGFELDTYYSGGFEYIGVFYYPETDKDGFFTVTEEFKEVEDLTKSLFKMMGFGLGYRFEGVEFIKK
jgi:hypothetical protein